MDDYNLYAGYMLVLKVNYNKRHLAEMLERKSYPTMDERLEDARKWLLICEQQKRKTVTESETARSRNANMGCGLTSVLRTLGMRLKSVFQRKSE